MECDYTEFELEVYRMNNLVIMKDMEDIFSRNINWKKLDGKTILLTGAYGMLASYIVYFVDYLNAVKNINVEIIALVRNADKFQKRFDTISKKNYVHVIKNDLSGKIEIDKNIDYVIHAASLASPQYYSTIPVDVMLPNTIGTNNLLELAVEKKVKGFLLFSSVDIYGSIEKEGLYNEHDAGVLDTLDVHNCYSESKRMAETMCKAYQIQYDVPVKIARIAHTYAPTMDVEKDPRVFSSFVKNIVENKNIEMKSDGSGKRTFCYITDAVAGYFTILLKGVSGEAYNVCNTSQYLSVLELAECLVNLYPEKGLKVIRKKRDKSENYTENTLLVGRTNIPDNSKLRGLGWEALVEVKDGFNRVIQYLDN